MPDANDRHALAATIKTPASVIVPEKSKRLPAHILRPLDLQLRTTDPFVADTIDPDQGRAVAAIRRMRKPSNYGCAWRRGLTQSVDVLRAHIDSL